MNIELGGVEIARQALEAALAAAAPYVRVAGEALEQYRTVRGWLESMAGVERKLEELRLRLERMRDQGYAKAEDFASYELLVDNVYAMHVKADRAMRTAFARAPSVLSALPEPKRAPIPARAVSVFAGLRGQPTPAVAFAGAGAGLGATPPPIPPVVAAPLGAAPWMWAVIVIASALAIIVVAVVVGGALFAEVVRDTVVNHDYLDRQAEVWARRDAHVQACIDAGGTPTECASRAINLFPAPQLARLPRPYGWVKWVAAAVITVAVVGGLVYLVRAFKKPKALQGAQRARYRKLTPDEFANARGDYGLEVD